MTALKRYKIPLLLLLIIFFTKSYSQTYKYKVKWDLRRSMGSSELFFYLNTGDSYPYNGNFAYILNNYSVSVLDGVVVSNTPLRLTQALKEPSGSFTQRSGIYVTAPESGYWQNTFGSPLGENGHNINLPDKKIVQADFTDRKITFESLAAGNYFLHYQTYLNNGSTPTADKFSDPFLIENPDALSFNILETQPICFGEIGKIQIKATGGKSSYYYTVDSGSGLEFTSITNIIDISGGAYNIKVRDTNNCIDLQANDAI